MYPLLVEQRRSCLKIMNSMRRLYKCLDSDHLSLCCFSSSRYGSCAVSHAVNSLLCCERSPITSETSSSLQRWKMLRKSIIHSCLETNKDCRIPRSVSSMPARDLILHFRYLYRSSCSTNTRCSTSFASPRHLQSLPTAPLHSLRLPK